MMLASIAEREQFRSHLAAKLQLFFEIPLLFEYFFVFLQHERYNIEDNF